MEVKLLSYNELNDCFWNDFDFITNQYIVHNVQMNSKWLKSYIVNYLKPTAIFIMAAFYDNKLVGCMPLQIEKQRGTRFWNLRVLKILGNGPTDFYDIPVVKGFEKEVTYLFVDFLSKNSKWDKLHINNISTNSLAYDCFKKSLKETGLIFKENTPNGYFWVDTTNMTWEEYEDNIFKTNNKDLLKSERRLMSDGLEIFVKTYKKDIYSHLEMNLGLYEQRRSTQGQKNSYVTAERRNFLKMAIELYEKENSVELSLLHDNLNNILAFQLDWIVNGVRYHWNHAYNEKYKRYSPGKLLLRLLMEKSFKDPNIYSCNHMRGLAKYKSKLVDNQEYLGQIIMINPKSIRYKLTILIGLIYKTLRKI